MGITPEHWFEIRLQQSTVPLFRIEGVLSKDAASDEVIQRSSPASLQLQPISCEVIVSSECLHKRRPVAKNRSGMPRTKLQWAVRTATASFELDYNVCFCTHVDHISLPPFYAPKDDDLAWQITVTRQPKKAPAWTEECNDGQWLSFDLSFKSSSGKLEVPIERIVDISQSVTQDVITKLCEKHPNELTKESFSSSSNICLSNVDASGENIGSVYMCNTDRDNKVVIDVELTISDGTLSIENPPPQPPVQALKKSEENSLRALGSSLHGLLQSGLMSDVKLSVDGHELRAHRSILAARSDVFQAMFASDCRESASGIVKIEDIRLPVFNEFLRFIYTGSLSASVRTITAPAVKRRRAAVEDGANAGAQDRQQAADEDDCLMELLVAADKYLVEDLKEVCQGWLLDRLSADVDEASVLTLCDVLRAGHHLASAPLREVGIGYLRTHRAAVLASPEWEEFAATNRRVAADALLDSMMPPKGEDP